MTSTCEQLREYIFGLDIIDTHEHLPGREENRDKNADVLSEYLTHYFSCDLVSAGLTPEQLQIARDVKRTRERGPGARRESRAAGMRRGLRQTSRGDDPPRQSHGDIQPE
jgi:hypothetical protein